jgi:hypothetical protein
MPGRGFASPAGINPVLQDSARLLAPYGNLDTADDLLINLPKRLKLDLINRLNTAINDCVKMTLNP